MPPNTAIQPNDSVAANHDALTLFVARKRHRLLFITHNWGGGTARHIHDLSCLVRDDCDVMVLAPYDTNTLQLAWRTIEDMPEAPALTGASKEFTLYFAINTEFDLLIETLQALGIVRVHLHHVHGLPKAVLSIGEKLNVPLDITLHDHYPLSPNYVLFPGGELVAPAPSNAWGLSLADWQATMHSVLVRAARVISPSHYLAMRITQQWSDIKPMVMPHPVATIAPMQVTKVLILGRLSPEKGLDVLRQVAEYAKQYALPIHFHVVGAITAPIAIFPALPVTIGGEYVEADIVNILARERADVIWFPSQCPESFSYTLSIAEALGTPIVAARLGALVERLTDKSDATLINWDAEAKTWADALLAAVKSSNNLPVSTTSNETAYRNFYLAPIAREAFALSDATFVAAIRRTYFIPPKSLTKLAGDELPLETLYTLGVECGHGEAKRELKRRVGNADQRLVDVQTQVETLQRELQDVTDAMLHEQSMVGELSAHVEVLDSDLVEARAALQTTRETLEAERDSARAAFDGISHSRAWRMTAPIRYVLHMLKQIVRGGKDIANNSKNLPHQMSIATQILRAEGPVALRKRVQEKFARRAEIPVKPVAHYLQETAISALAIHSSATPQVSIIIPVYGQHVMTYTCLKSIAETCGKESIEVIVIDDCSPEPAAEALREIGGITIVRNDVNLGFLKNCNKAAAMARGEFVLLLNNDVIVTPGWLAALRRVWEERADVGMVGAKLIYPDGRLQEAGGILWRDGSAWNWGRNQDASLPAYNYLREVDYCSGACLMLKREFWNQLDGFDERYVPAYYEDTDLAFRVREAGKKVFYQPAAVIVHFEGQSSGTDVTQGVKQHQVINQETFYHRWRHVLAKHRINGLMPQLERDRYAKRRVLVMDACMLTPDQDAGSLRMIELLGLMAKMGCKVTFIADNLEYRDPYVAQIQALGVEVIYHPVHSNVTRFLERHAAEYEVIILSRVTVAMKHIDTVRMTASRAKIIFDTVDLHFLRQEREAELANDPIQRAAAQRMKASELEIMAKSDVTLVVSAFEEKLLAEIAPATRVEIVSVVHVNMPGSATFNERKGAVFIGGFRHPPNLDAVTWYVEKVLPILRAKNANFVTTIIGSNAPPSLQKFAADDFVIAGFVADVTPYYHAAKLSISPLRYGAGVKGKVNIAMQYGVPVVATSPSVEGMYLRDGEDVLRADSAEDFANAMIRANTDEALWSRLRANGLINIETHFSRETARKVLAGLLEC